MAIDPEVIPPSSSAGDNAVRQFPKWMFYGAGLVAVLASIVIIKMLLPLLIMGLLLGFIWTKAKSH